MLENIFTTERLLVRHFHPGDLDVFATLCADPLVLRYVGDGTTLPRSEVARWIGICQEKYAARSYGTSAVFERASGDFIGYCGVVRAPGNDFDELIYVFHTHVWGRGYATEAAGAMLRYVFERAPLGHIYATIYLEHHASVHVVTKLGFAFEREEPGDDGEPVAYYVVQRNTFE